ncbi:Diaminopimelate epimerase [Ephemeroptericola cinctiostellae]|uniref:Diaminopimelate epimerase n=1 Tax=Ephemeroptericola cinctiostellae TaxID=2268024 RepID=A0A345DD15_9BURK|nr:diaminopimelate epimerase [Ephemeroptericola cinctiostellae]AXF86253.1 Diaminopimelate epimerase [Ephemeroptericola cinctiostellae]
MELKFTKMHGAGNDFIVFNAIEQDLSALTADDWRALGNRQFGIGADQILLVEKPTIAGMDFKYTIYNNDGSLVENCGNGARCFVKYVYDQGLTQHLANTREVAVQIATGTMVLKLNDDGSVTVNMGAPGFVAADLPAVVDGLPTRAQAEDTLYEVQLTHGERRDISLVSMGNPHAVQIVTDVDAAPVLTEGAELEVHPMFPRRVNVGFMQVMNPHHIKVRIFERGAGETLACGTGACAAVVAGIRRGVLTSPVRVSARGGELSIAWAGTGEPVLMSGPAVTVFDGQITI